MNYYKRHIGDYAAATRHLSMLEHGAYTMLLDIYYTTEQPLPSDPKKAARKAGARSKDEVSAVELVLSEFFDLQADGWHSARCDAEISEYAAGSEEREQKEANEKDRMKRYRERRAMMFSALRERDVVPAWDVSMKDLQRLYDATCNAPETHLQRVAGRSHETPATAITTNQEPLTINQEPINTPLAPNLAENREGGFGDVSQPVGTEAGRICRAMRQAGIADTNPGNQALLTLLAAGANEAEFVGAAVDAVGNGKGFAYALGIVAGERKRAAALAGQVLRGTLPKAETAYQRSMRERMQEVAPEAALPDPATAAQHPARAAEFFNAIEVQSRTVEQLP